LFKKFYAIIKKEVKKVIKTRNINEKLK